MSALDPQPAPVSVETTVLFADGSRTIIRYAPEDGGDLRVELAEEDPDEYEIMQAMLASRQGLYRPVQRTKTHRVKVEQIGSYEIEHLVRASPRR